MNVSLVAFRGSPAAAGRVASTMFYVYAIYNNSNSKIYVGQTDDIERRVVEHNSPHNRKFTGKFQGGWVLIYHESVPTRSEALLRERQLKSHKGRDFLKTYIPG